MALDRVKDGTTEKKQVSGENFKTRVKKDKAFQTKVVIRRLPPSMTQDEFMVQISPVPDYDYFHFVKADVRLGQHAFSRAYLNFLHSEDIFIFKDKFDNYVFLDAKGNEYPAIVEFAPFQKIPKKRSKKKDPKCGTIEADPDYVSFLENLKNPDAIALPTAEFYLEEIEMREKELKANNGVMKTTTPLLEYIKQRKIEQQRIREEKREERKRRELERKRLREEDRRRKKAERDKQKERLLKEKESNLERESYDEATSETAHTEETKQPEIVVQVLKNPDREKEMKEQLSISPKTKSFYVKPSKDKEKFKDWEYEEEKDKSMISKEKSRTGNRIVVSTKDRGRREKTEYKSSYSGYKSGGQASNASHSSSTYYGKKPGYEETSSKKGKATTTIVEKSPAKGKKDRIFYSNVKNSSKVDEESKKDSLAASKSGVGSSADAKKNDDSKDCNNKDPRTERRIRNKDRPTMEIYRPGMRRFSTQRNSPQKEISTSTSNSSSPSPTPPLNYFKHSEN